MKNKFKSTIKMDIIDKKEKIHLFFKVITTLLIINNKEYNLPCAANTTEKRHLFISEINNVFKSSERYMNSEVITAFPQLTNLPIETDDSLVRDSPSYFHLKKKKLD